jgi:hypothetical protein
VSDETRLTTSRDVERVRALAKMLDAAVRIPGTNIRF